MQEDSYTRGAAAFVIQDNSILLTERKHAPNPGYWEVPAGKWESGESSEETAIREVKEETGLDIEIIEKMGEIRNDEYKFHSHIFLANVKGGTLGNYALDENSQVAFIRTDALPENVGESTLWGIELLKEKGVIKQTNSPLETHYFEF